MMNWIKQQTSKQQTIKQQTSKQTPGSALMLALTLMLTLLVGLTPATANAATLRTDLLVTTDWLTAHLNDANLVILHVSRDRTAYDAGHVPGARFIGQGELVVTREGVLNELPTVDALKALFEKAGVTDASRVILYSDATVLPATRAYFTLDYLGFGDKAALLDGGLTKWKAEMRTVSQEAPVVVAGRMTPKVKAAVLATMESVKPLTAAGAGMTLLDARTADEFAGKNAAAEITRPGHIPNSKSVFWMEGLASRQDMSLQTEAQLRRLYEAAGITPDKPVVTYCNTGMQATQSYFTLKYLGYDVKMYDGSFSEWSNAKGTEVAK